MPVQVDVDVVQHRAALWRPSASSALVCLATSRSVCAVGLKFSRFETRPERADAGRVDRGDAASRTRACWSSSPRSSASDPAGAPGHVVAGRADDVRDVELSRTIVTPGRGTVSLGDGPVAGGAERLGLEVGDQVARR